MSEILPILEETTNRPIHVKYKKQRSEHSHRLRKNQTASRSHACRGIFRTFLRSNPCIDQYSIFVRIRALPKPRDYHTYNHHRHRAPHLLRHLCNCHLCSTTHVEKDEKDGVNE